MHWLGCKFMIKTIFIIDAAFNFNATLGFNLVSFPVTLEVICIFKWTIFS